MEDPAPCDHKEDEDLGDINCTLVYGLTKRPANTGMFIVLSLQQCFLMVSSPLVVVYIIQSALCGAHDPRLFAELLSTHIVLHGVMIILQITAGIRLPMIVGSLYTYLAVITASMESPKWACPSNTTSGSSNTSIDVSNSSEPIWLSRVQVVSGGVIVASSVQLILGLTGLAGWLVKLFGPLTVAPALSLLGLSLASGTAKGAQHQWGITVGVVVLVLLMSIVLAHVEVPIPLWNQEKKCHHTTYPLFRLVPAIIAIAIGWLFCLILTKAGVLPSDPNAIGYKARTDAKLEVLEKTSWFIIPYPGRFGLPLFEPDIIIGMCVASMVAVVESAGTYYAVASICAVRVPPTHAVSRGLLVEGIGTLVSGLAGGACGYGSYGSSIGTISMTSIGSRHIWILGASFMIVCGTVGKFGAVLSIIPDPVISGCAIVSIGCLISVGLSTLQHANMNTTRNIMVLGVSFFAGIMLPDWIKTDPKVINTGNGTADQILISLFSSSMLVGAILGFLLDNVLPGSRKDRGLEDFHSEMQADFQESETIADSRDTTYDIPYITEYLYKHKIFSYVPFLPPYSQPSCGYKRIQTEDLR